MARKARTAPNLPPELRYHGVTKTEFDGKKFSGLENQKTKRDIESEQRARRKALMSDPQKKSEATSMAKSYSKMKYEPKIKGDPKKYAAGHERIFGKKKAAPRKAKKTVMTAKETREFLAWKDSQKPGDDKAATA